MTLDYRGGSRGGGQGVRGGRRGSRFGNRGGFQGGRASYNTLEVVTFDDDSYVPDKNQLDTQANFVNASFASSDSSEYYAELDSLDDYGLDGYGTY